MVEMFNEDKNDIFRKLNPSQSILDLSTFPFLEKIISKNEHHPFQQYCIPDTIPLLLSKARDNPQYYSYITKLFLKWTSRDVDIQYLSELFQDLSQLPKNIKIIGKNDIDTEIYAYCYENIEIKDLVVEFSPKFNIIGDIFGKLLGYARKTKTPILMFNQRLVRLAKSIPVLLNDTLKLKQDFLAKRMPYIDYGRGIRFYIGIILEMGGLVIPIPLANEVGYILMVLDP